MGEAIGHVAQEFSFSPINTGRTSQGSSGTVENPFVLPDTGQVIPQAMTVSNPGAPIYRQSFLTAFLSSLGPALAGGLMSQPGAPFGTGLGGALAGIQEQSRYNTGLQIANSDRQRQNAVAQAQIASSTAETNRLNQTTPLDVQEKQLNTDLLKAQIGFFSNPGNLQNAVSDATKSLGDLTPTEQAQMDAAKQDAKLKRSFDPISAAVKNIAQDRVVDARASQTPEKQELRDYLTDSTIDKGKNKNAATFAAWKARLAPTATFNLQAGLLNSDTITMAAENYFLTGQLPSGTRSPAIISQILNRASQLHPGESLAANTAAYKANVASLNSLQKQFDAVSAFENTAIRNLDQVAKAGANIPDLSSRFANVPVRNISASMIGTPEMARFRTALLTAQTEAARVLGSANAAGVLTNEQRDDAKKVLDGYLPYPAMMASIDQLKTDFGNRHSSYAQQIADIKARTGGKPAGATGVAPDSNGQLHWTDGTRDLGVVR